MNPDAAPPAAPVRVAAAQFPVFQPRSEAEVEHTLTRWVAEAAEAGAQLLVFPEYAAMMMAAWPPRRAAASLHAELQAAIAHHAEWQHWHAQLARRYGVHILAGSGPVAVNGRVHNRAHLFAPGGASGWQDKWTMTRFEHEHWGISPGECLKVFDTALGMIAVNICYDVEFPLLARAQVHAGATIILAPSCTDTAAGYWRVRLGAQARALENQCAVVQAPLVGDALWSAAVDVNVGAAGIYAPPDRGLPDNGVLALGEWNRPQWLHAALDAARFAAVRADGQVFNHRDWHRQPGLGTAPPVVVERLR